MSTPIQVVKQQSEAPSTPVTPVAASQAAEEARTAAAGSTPGPKPTAGGARTGAAKPRATVGENLGYAGWALNAARLATCVEGNTDEERPGGGKRSSPSSIFSLWWGEAGMSKEEELKLKFGSNKGDKKAGAPAAADAFLKEYVAFVPRRVLPQLPDMAEAVARCRWGKGRRAWELGGL